MLLGVLSDTHGRTGPLSNALKLLSDHGVEAMVHCGDIGDFGPHGDARPVLDRLAGTGCHFVWGNNDAADAAAEKYARDLGLHPLGRRGMVTLDGRRIRVEHGDDFTTLRKLIRRADAGEDVGCDLLLTGHSHLPHDKTHGLLRWINPGALHRASVYTVCTIELSSLKMQSIVVEK